MRLLFVAVLVTRTSNFLARIDELLSQRSEVEGRQAQVAAFLAQYQLTDGELAVGAGSPRGFCRCALRGALTRALTRALPPFLWLPWHTRPCTRSHSRWTVELASSAPFAAWTSSAATASN